MLIPRIYSGAERYRARTGHLRPERPDPIVIERPVRDPESPAVYYVSAGIVRAVLVADEGLDVPVAELQH